MKGLTVDIRDSILTLTKAGRRQEVETLIQETTDRAAKTYGPIEANDTLSDKGRFQQLALAYTQYERGVAQKLERLARAVINTDRDDVERVFGVKGLPGDPATLIISRRDAGDRVKDIHNSEELAEELKRATRLGDEVMAHAIAQRAVEIHNDESAQVLHQFLADRPALDKPVERLWNGDTGTYNSLRDTALIAGLRPTELQDLSAGRIAELAASSPEQPAAADPFRFSAPGPFVDQPAGFVSGAIFSSDD